MEENINNVEVEETEVETVEPELVEEQEEINDDDCYTCNLVGTTIEQETKLDSTDYAVLGIIAGAAAYGTYKMVGFATKQVKRGYGKICDWAKSKKAKHEEANVTEAENVNDLDLNISDDED